MKHFSGKLAVITGGGTGIGRELARQLASEGCSVAICDVSAADMAETVRLAEAAGASHGVRITAHLADVSDEAQIQRFQRDVAELHQTDRINLLFNNAGIGGGVSMITDAREEWERVFNICWGGVYYGVRAFLPMLIAADEGHIINTSSVNGFWASLGPRAPHTAYAAAKFAVKGFTEALITDLRLNAPHVECSVVMPGHIGTSIVTNYRKLVTGSADDGLSAEDIDRVRRRLAAAGADASLLTDEAIQARAAEQHRRFLEDAPTTAAQAAETILAGVRTSRWRILVGDDAHVLDTRVREAPEEAYEVSFHKALRTNRTG